MGNPGDMNLTAKFFQVFASHPRPTADRIVKSYVHEGEELCSTLADVTREELSAADIRNHIRDNLWMLTPEAFRYFLPAFMAISLTPDGSASSFAVDLVEALTVPARADIIKKYEWLSEMPLVGGLTSDILETVNKQELEMFDSGDIPAAFNERVGDFTRAEGEAVLAFLETLRKEYAANFPFGEVDIAIDRYWSRFS